MNGGQTNHWKLGLFVVSGVGAALGSLFWVGASRMSRETIPRMTFFDESVQGLDIGSAVKMRGVPVGSVSRITFGEDRRLVEVWADLYLDVMVRLGLGTAEEWRSPDHKPPPDLRAQLASAGLMGPKFLLIDFFPGAEKIELPFEEPDYYVPSVRSVSKNIEDGITTLTHELPETLETLEKLATTLESKLSDLDVAAISTELTRLLADSDALVKRTDGLLGEVDMRALDLELHDLLQSLDDAAERFDGLLATAERGEGPVGALTDAGSSLAASTDEFLDFAAGELQAADLPATLRSLREALHSLQALTSYFERQPGALIRGRTPDYPPPDPNDR
ncbi:MAG: MlaD family protein [Planctomycetota bacterium]